MEKVCRQLLLPDTDHFDLAATLCFFGGILLTMLLDLLVGGLQKLECGCCCIPSWFRERSLYSHFKKKAEHQELPIHATNSSLGTAVLGSLEMDDKSTPTTGTEYVPPNGVLDPSLTNGAPPFAAIEVEREEGQEETSSNGGAKFGRAGGDLLSDLKGGVKLSENGLIQEKALSNESSSDESSEALGPIEFKEVTEGLGKSTKKLHRMGILTGMGVWMGVRGATVTMVKGRDHLLFAKQRPSPQFYCM
jgi:hypothetical protein